MRDFLQPQEGSFLLVLIVFLVLCHFRVSGVPFLGTPCRSGSLRESCIANMRVILGAIEIYNMDHPTKLSRIDADVLEDLLRKGPARFFSGLSRRYQKQIGQCLYPVLSAEPGLEPRFLMDFTVPYSRDCIYVFRVG